MGTPVLLPMGIITEMSGDVVVVGRTHSDVACSMFEGGFVAQLSVQATIYRCTCNH